MSHKLARNLDTDEWLAAWFGTTRSGGPDIHFGGPNGPDRHLLYGVFAVLPVGSPAPGEKPRTFVEELEARGYDTTTIEFRVRRRPSGGPEVSAPGV